MKAKELMIGDWVEYNNDTMEVIFNARVTEIGKDYIKTDHTGGDECFEDEIEPIPLTEEILEANEWKCYNTFNQYSHSAAPFELQKESGCWSARAEADEYGSSTFACIAYLHELQHLLKLVGIDVEIKL